MLRIERLTESSEAAYDEFVSRSDESLFFFSGLYRRFLIALLGADDHYLIAYRGNEIVGALPVFARNGRLGCILNSLPFYGSNGGVIEHSHDPEVRSILVSSFLKLARERNCLTATVITSPFESESESRNLARHFDLVDQRIGQLTPLPESANADASNVLMGMFHYKTRNMVRKATKEGVVVREGFSQQALRFLIDTHQENMREIGGIPKVERFFLLMPEMFRYGTDYRIYSAYKNDVPVAALLVLYFNKVAEYCTPVIKAEFRNLQGMSALIYHAMLDAIRAGYKWWNWGGTWLSQEGVYRFKSRWGTIDKVYHYYTKILNAAVLQETPQSLLEAYPNFFVVPFSKLAAESKNG